MIVSAEFSVAFNEMGFQPSVLWLGGVFAMVFILVISRLVSKAEEI